MKPWYTSRTVWFNVLTIVVAVATYLGWTPNQAVAQDVASFLIAFSPVANLVLRFFTSQSIVQQ